MNELQGRLSENTQKRKKMKRLKYTYDDFGTTLKGQIGYWGPERDLCGPRQLIEATTPQVLQWDIFPVFLTL